MRAATNLVYIDTNILIYLFENHEHYSKEVAKKLESFAAKGYSFISSVITITEFVSGTNAVNANILKKVPRLAFVELDSEIAVKAGELLRNNNLNIGDSLHLATAVELKAKSFFTNDKDLAKITSKYMQVTDL